MNTTFENGLKEYIQEVQRVSQGAISNEETAKSLLRSVESLKTVQDKMQTQLASAVQTLEGFASKMPAPERESISLEKVGEVFSFPPLPNALRRVPSFDDWSALMELTDRRTVGSNGRNSGYAHI